MLCASVVVNWVMLATKNSVASANSVWSWAGPSPASPRPEASLSSSASS